MIIIDGTVVSDDLISIHFICDLAQCKGNCCVSGDAGAPLETHEISKIEENLDLLVEYLTPAGMQVVLQNGSFDYDDAGNYVTPLVNDRECAFTGFHENGLSYCTIEKAYLDGKIDFRKPISCYLYPVRLSEAMGIVHVNYHQWSICNPGRRKGAKAGVALYKFLKDPLIARFGLNWYNQLDTIAKARQ